MSRSLRETVAMVGRVVLGAAMIGVGVLHFVDPAPFVLIMPDYLPAHEAAVFLSGVVEVALGAALFVPNVKLRAWAGWGLVALYLAVWPANIWMASEGVQLPGVETSATAAWIRVALQPLLMLWAWAVTRPPRDAVIASADARDI